MPRSVSASGLAGALACALAAIGCASRDAREGTAIHDFEMRARVARAEVGQSVSEAHAILGRDPVHRPGHPEQPFPSPVSVVLLETPLGESLRIEFYVVAARRAVEGACPDVHVEEMPVVFHEDNLGGIGWEVLEGGWRSWGGSLDTLRRLRDTQRCEVAPAIGTAP